MAENWLARLNPQIHCSWHGSWRKGFIEPARTVCDHELVAVSEGECLIELAGRSLRVRQGSYAIIPPGQVHRTVCTGELVTRHCVHFDWIWQGDFMDDRENLWTYGPVAAMPEGWLRPAPDFVPFERVGCGSMEDPELIFDLFRSVEARRGFSDELNSNLARSSFQEILIRLFAASAPEETDAPANETLLALEVKRLLDEAEFPLDGSVRSLVARCGRSYEHLCRIFKRKFGIPPLRYLTYAKLERARSQLRAGRSSVSEIAFELGFSDLAHFSKTFKKYSGMAPLEYARRSQSQG
jgi:AraC-like DNA-binding protein